MGTYNSTEIELDCPRCGAPGTHRVDLYFGNTSHMEDVPLGSPYPFCGGRAHYKGGPPRSEPAFGMGYTECQACGLDFHCLAEIRNRELVGVQVDMEHPPLVAFEEVELRAACPECSADKGWLQVFEGYEIGRFSCGGETCYFSCLVKHDKDCRPLEFPFEPKSRVTLKRASD